MAPWRPCPSHNALLLQTLAHLKPLRRRGGDQQLGTGPRKQSLGDPQVDLAGRAEVGATSQWVWDANRNHVGNFRDPIKTHGEVISHSWLSFWIHSSVFWSGYSKLAHKCWIWCIKRKRIRSKWNDRLSTPRTFCRTCPTGTIHVLAGGMELRNRCGKGGTPLHSKIDVKRSWKAREMLG